MKRAVLIALAALLGAAAVFAPYSGPAASGLRWFGYTLLAWATTWPARRFTWGRALVAVGLVWALRAWSLHNPPAAAAEAWWALLAALVGPVLAYFTTPRGYDPHFDLVVPWVYGHLARRTHGARPQTLLRFAAVEAHHRVLDVGGGAGRTARHMEHARQVVVLDPSPFMLAEARKRPRLHPVQGFAERLPFPAATFDRVIIVDALHHMRGQEDALREAWRVLAPRGRLILEEPNPAHPVGRAIALGERLLGMPSRFQTPEALAAQFPQARVQVEKDAWRAWVVVEKP
ncbi:MAG: class I SAM-dependent methyltransferase [Chloroflexi bacterium]|nr:class I SAM-dependent methyltransferase [Chloroflexota bacterium]